MYELVRVWERDTLEIFGILFDLFFCPGGYFVFSNFYQWCITLEHSY